MKSNGLTVYGQKGDVSELAERITQMLPGVKSLGQAGALALAQVAYSMSLNPFTGEIWAIPQKDRNGRVIGFSIMAGIKGLRRAARKQAQEMGGVYPFYRPKFRMLSDEEKELANLKQDDKALVCELELVLPPNHPWYQANNHARYIVEGVGIVRQGERSRMELIQLVRKRAEADALKMAFDIPFGDSGDEFAIEAEYQINGNSGPDWDLEGSDIFDDEPEITKETADVDADPAPETQEDDEKKAPRPYKPEMVKVKLQNLAGTGKTKNDPAASEKQVGFIASLLNQAFDGRSDPDGCRLSVLDWLWGPGLETSKALTMGEASATITWLKDQDADGALHPDAKIEAHMIYRRTLRERGQLELLPEGEQELAEFEGLTDD